MKQDKHSWTIRFRMTLALAIVPIASGCAGPRTKDVPPDEAVKLNRQLVREAVLYDPGTETGAVVPEISAPRLHAIFVPEHIENNRLIEAHREWQLEGDVTLLGIPAKLEPKAKK